MALPWSMIMEGEDVVGLDIGRHSVSAVRLRSNSNGHWKVLNAGVMRLAQGAADQGVAYTIRSLWRQSRMSCSRVCSCLRSPSMLVRHFKYPPLTNAEIRSALQLTVEEVLQMSTDRFHLDWHLFDRAGVLSSQPPREAQTEGFLVAVPKKEAQNHLALLEAAGLHAVVLDVGCTAIANLFLTLRGNTRNGEAVCLINLQDYCVDLAILNENNFLYPCSIYSPMQVWGQALERLVENIRNELKYFEYKLCQNPVQKVVLMGPADLCRQLAEHLQKTLTMPIEHWNPLEDPRFHVTHTARTGWNDGAGGLLSATSLGLALRSG